MKQWYYARRCYGNNEFYLLRHADAGTPAPEGWERVTRKEAERMRTDNRLYYSCSYVCRSDFGDLDILPFKTEETGG